MYLYVEPVLIQKLPHGELIGNDQNTSLLAPRLFQVDAPTNDINLGKRYAEWVFGFPVKFKVFVGVDVSQVLAVVVYLSSSFLRRKDFSFFLLLPRRDMRARGEHLHMPLLKTRGPYFDQNSFLGLS